jgi:hypothetical protein
MSGKSGWNGYDTAYSLTGLFFGAMLFGRFGEEAWLPGILLVLAYFAGRAAGANH